MSPVHCTIFHCITSILFYSNLQNISNTLKQYVFFYSLVLFLYPLFLNCHTIFAHKLESSVNCSSDEFVFQHTNGTAICHPLLTCQDVEQMKPIKLLAHGVVKNIWLVQWRQSTIVMAKLTNQLLSEDFTANRQNLLYFRGDRRVSRLLGHCGNGTIFTQYYPNGNALGLQSLFARYRIDAFVDRFRLCIEYAQILALLHHHSMVMCDSNSVAKTLTQYLVGDHFELILNDLDALPRMDAANKRTKCGRRQVSGDLVAPEQQWPFADRPFDDSLMPSYNEKVDIWKLPDICHWIVGDLSLTHKPYQQPAITLARKMLHHIHSQCKVTDPQARPTAPEIVRFYLFINRLL